MANVSEVCPVNVRLANTTDVAVVCILNVWLVDQIYRSMVGNPSETVKKLLQKTKVLHRKVYSSAYT